MERCSLEEDLSDIARSQMTSDRMQPSQEDRGTAIPPLLPDEALRLFMSLIEFVAGKVEHDLIRPDIRQARLVRLVRRCDNYCLGPSGCIRNRGNQQLRNM